MLFCVPLITLTLWIREMPSYTIIFFPLNMKIIDDCGMLGLYAISWRGKFQIMCFIVTCKFSSDSLLYVSEGGSSSLTFDGSCYDFLPCNVAVFLHQHLKDKKPTTELTRSKLTRVPSCSAHSPKSITITAMAMVQKRNRKFYSCPPESYTHSLITSMTSHHSFKTTLSTT